MSQRLRLSPSLLLLPAFALILLRAPVILTQGRFWAEEGTIYLPDALGGWWDALLAPRMGYYSVWTRLAALAAASLPPEVAPLATAWAALLVQLAVIWIALRSDAFPGPLGPPLAAAVLLLALPSGEVWLNTVNSHFHFAVGAALLLVTAPGRLPAAFRLGFLAMAVLTGPVTAFLAPFFAWRALRQPSRLAGAEAAVVGAGALLQGALLLAGMAGGARAAGFDPAALLAALGVKLLALPVLGAGANRAAAVLLGGGTGARLGVVAALSGIAALLLAAVLPQARARVLLAAGIWLALLSIAGALLADPWMAVPPLNAGRYAYAPNALAGLALVAVATAPAALLAGRILAAALLAVILAQGMLAWPDRTWALSGPDWRAEVAAWRADPARTSLAIWPAGWTMTLARPAPR
ncbi:hypothetical protein [Paracraurococcus ruber]|uniref:Uncharacterized protein n=1 Tax=Paracraurococcus ruber TaxID=77675 RepID=A0ABS1CW83_9PROT|nr:hypothetical protein [Paracraurococcus ruber]MBK1658781.1 hypothetical protein [Paracraurococcus ruber]TDG30094.1 hypothetical protein E2C05_15680 [Paracraurococcus ruber]